ncbi:hypothetical protein HY523_02685 [Candidatus Berkelbacteria bacterium]|nr:hypothetical protein [Candidatus Berkelbacteria bacterium]
MDLREARLLAAQCWAAAGDHDIEERSRRHPDLYPPLTSADVSRLCDELLLIDDASVRVLTLTAMFIHHHPTAYPAIVARSLVDFRNGAMLSHRDMRCLQWKNVSRAARTYCAMVIFDERGIRFGEELLEFFGSPLLSDLPDDEMDDQTYREMHGTVGWVSEPDGTKVFRELTAQELREKRQREEAEAREQVSYHLATMACSSQESAVRLARKQSDVAAFIEQMVSDLFDDEVPFSVFYAISQIVSQIGGSRTYLDVDKLLVNAVTWYIACHGMPESLTEYHLNNGMTAGSVSFNSCAQPRWYRRQTPPAWIEHQQQDTSSPCS